MIRITKLLALAFLILVVACEQTDTEEPLLISDEASELNIPESGLYPVMIFDKASAMAQLSDCEAGVSSYFCGVVAESLLDLAADNPLFAVPRRPRHCPMSMCGLASGIKGPKPRVPGTICEPQLCAHLFGENCLSSFAGLKFAVKAGSLENVSGYLISGEEVITSTDLEMGGSVSEGFECNSAQLNFGIPIPEIAEPGMWIHINTNVIINGELVDTSFKVQL